MSYRDWQRKHPSAPPRMQDLVRDKRKVRLLENIRTHGGARFATGTVCVVDGASCGKLHLLDGTGQYVRMVSLRQVEMADEVLMTSGCSGRSRTGTGTTTEARRAAGTCTGRGWRPQCRPR